MELDEKEIIRIYGKRWDIEVFFKTCKQMLKLESECKSLSYDALTAHVSIVFTRYMVLSVEKRLNEDDRTVGELFFLMADELQDITFNQSMAMNFCICPMIRSIHCSPTLSHVYLSICVIPCILPTPHDIELPFLPLTAGSRLIFGVGSLS